MEWENAKQKCLKYKQNDYNVSYEMYLLHAING